MKRKYFLIILSLILAIFLSGCNIGIGIIPPVTDEIRVKSVIQEYYLALTDQNWSKAKSYCIYGSEKYYRTCVIEDAINTLYLYCNIVTINTYVDISDISIYGNYSDAYCYVHVTISACGYFESDSAYGILRLQRVGNSWKLY